MARKDSEKSLIIIIIGNLDSSIDEVLFEAAVKTLEESDYLLYAMP